MNHPDPALRGLTAEQLLNVGTEAVSYIRQQSTPAYQPVQQQAPTEGLRDDDIVDVKTMRQYAQSVAQQAQNPGLQQQIAQMAFDQVSREPQYQEVFQKYPVEIQNHLRQMPATMWTLDNLRMVGKFVRGEHVDELAEAKANLRLQNMQGLPIRGNGLGSVSQSVDSDGLPANWQETLTKVGVSLAQVDGFCVANGWDRSKWFKHYAKDGSAMGSRS